MKFKQYLVEKSTLKQDDQEQFNQLSDKDIISYDLTDPVKLVRMGKVNGGNFSPFKNAQEAKVAWGRELEDIVTITKKDYMKKFKVLSEEIEIIESNDIKDLEKLKELLQSRSKVNKAFDMMSGFSFYLIRDFEDVIGILADKSVDDAMKKLDKAIKASEKKKRQRKADILKDFEELVQYLIKKL